MKNETTFEELFQAAQVNIVLMDEILERNNVTLHGLNKLPKEEYLIWKSHLNESDRLNLQMVEAQKKGNIQKKKKGLKM